MAKSKPVSPARKAAFEILREVEAGAFSSILLAACEPGLKPADRALTHELVLGVLRWQLWLDKLIEHYAKRPVESLDQAVRLALRLGLYQLRFLERIPASAAVNESVNLVRSARVSSAAAFVNAVLRRAIRESGFEPSAGRDPLEKLAIDTSHPVWLLTRWVEAFGFSETEAFARANNRVPPSAFRIVKRDFRETPQDTALLDRLREGGGIIEPSNIAQDAWRVSGATALVRKLAENGNIYLQDEASQLVAQTVEVRSGERVLDLCAAPGGKTTLMAEQVRDGALIVASDISPRRLETIIKTKTLHELKSIECVLLDAAQQLPFENSVFDRLLVDAPCSGTGTLRRNPEIRWRISESDIHELAAQQKLFLSNAARVLKPGGQLVYSTCSVERDENEQVVERFLSENPQFTLAKATRLWPHREGTDGFFIASLQLATQQ